MGTASGTATLTVSALDHLVLSPASATIDPVGGSQSYTAEGYDASNFDFGNVTSSTTFTIAGGGSCAGSSCWSFIAGDHTITGTNGTAVGAATLSVRALDHLTLSPASATFSVSGSQTYTAEGWQSLGSGIYEGTDVTSSTTFTIAGGGSCTGATCTSSVDGDPPHLQRARPPGPESG
jgi:hypothetical protein